MESRWIVLLAIVVSVLAGGVARCRVQASAECNEDVRRCL